MKAARRSAVSRSRAARRHCTPGAPTRRPARPAGAAVPATLRAVPPHELAGAIAHGGPPRQDRQALEVAPDVVGQRLHRGVASLRLLAQGHQDDGVEVAPQAPAQAGRRPFGNRASRDGVARLRVGLSARRLRPSSPRCSGLSGSCSHDRPQHVEGLARLAAGRAGGPRAARRARPPASTRRWRW